MHLTNDDMCNLNIKDFWKEHLKLYIILDASYAWWNSVVSVASNERDYGAKIIYMIMTWNLKKEIWLLTMMDSELKDITNEFKNEKVLNSWIWGTYTWSHG